jgi:hypothetical protein
MAVTYENTRFGPIFEFVVGVGMKEREAFATKDS